MAEKTDLQYEICGVVVNCRAVAIIMNNNKPVINIFNFISGFTTGFFVGIATMTTSLTLLCSMVKTETTTTVKTKEKTTETL